VSGVLAIDAGTTGVRAIVFGSRRGERLGSAYREVRMAYPRPGWVEQDLEEIWNKTREVIAEALRGSTSAARDVAAIGITNQRSSIAAWDAHDGRALSPLISWQDARAADRAAALQAEGFFVTPNVSVTKAEWIVRNIESAAAAARSGRLRLGGMEAWLAWKLSGGAHVCDHANASATGFYSHLVGAWDDTLLTSVGLSRDQLPEIVDCSGTVAETSAEVFGATVPIAGLCGDQQAALFGLGCVEPGATKCSYGTSAMVDASSGTSITLGGPGTYPLLAWKFRDVAEPVWCVEGSVITAGAAVQWLRDSLGVIARAEDVTALAASVSSSGGVWVVPALQGLGTPYNDAAARALIGGLSRASGRAEIARALLEGVAQRVCDVADAVWAGTGRPSELRADGGASRNDLLLQLQADLLGLPVERSIEPDGSAFGVARLAALGAGIDDGVWGSSSWSPERVFDPRISADQRESVRALWSTRVALAASGAR
jgi:glycerol kinase